ncbi:MAG: cation diffusion facilitator family transporter [Pirellulales bacterium]|nr:cation diffusion facilitator family transporter [Pirellulales bacterium]
MTVSPPSSELGHADREKRRVALTSLLAAVLLTAMKLSVGIWTNSLGILSEAAHSGLDLVAAAMTLGAVRVSGRPADREHTYGHGKVENLSALGETLLLLITCVWIVYEAAARLLFRTHTEVDPNLWAFLVVVISIVVDYSRSRALKKTAKKYSSQALEANALHFSTDIWSSLVVLLGLVGVVVGKQFHVSWIEQADSVAALAVAGIVVGVSFRLGKKSVDDLLDSVPAELSSQVEEAVRLVPGVAGINQVRLRRSGADVFVDLTVTVERAAAFEQAHDVSEAVENAVRRLLPQADVVVHVEPAASPQEDVTTIVRVLAARRGLSAHGVRIYEDQGQQWLELHLEVSSELRLDEAHQQATQFEQALREEIPGLQRIVTHIEPAGDATATFAAEPVGESGVKRVLNEFIQEHRLAIHPHQIHVQQTGEELSVSLHCMLDPATAITDAHDLTVRLEDYLRQRIPDLGRVVIHVEPRAPKSPLPPGEG